MEDDINDMVANGQDNEDGNPGREKLAATVAFAF